MRLLLLLFAISFAITQALVWLTDINYYFIYIMFMLSLFVIGWLDYRYSVKRKPILHTMAKVKSKRKRGADYYSIFFLLANKKTIQLHVSRKQYHAVIEFDVVEIKYQGWLLHSLKRAKNEDEIINHDYFNKNGKKKFLT